MRNAWATRTTGFAERRRGFGCEEIDVNVRLERENGPVGVVVLVFDVDLSLGCPMSPFAQAVRRR